VLKTLSGSIILPVSKLENTLTSAVVVAPMGWCNGWASQEGRSQTQQGTTLWYRLIVSQGQSAEATAEESSLLLNRPWRAAAAAPMGCCNGWAYPEGHMQCFRLPSLPASNGTSVQNYCLTRLKYRHCWLRKNLHYLQVVDLVGD